MQYTVKFIDDGVVYSCSISRIKSNTQIDIGVIVNARYTDGRWNEAIVLDIKGKIFQPVNVIQ